MTDNMNNLIEILLRNVWIELDYYHFIYNVNKVLPQKILTEITPIVL